MDGDLPQSQAHVFGVGEAWHQVRLSPCYYVTGTHSIKVGLSSVQHHDTPRTPSLTSPTYSQLVASSAEEGEGVSSPTDSPKAKGAMAKGVSRWGRGCLGTARFADGRHDTAAAHSFQPAPSQRPWCPVPATGLSVGKASCMKSRTPGYRSNSPMSPMAVSACDAFLLACAGTRQHLFHFGANVPLQLNV